MEEILCGKTFGKEKEKVWHLLRQESISGPVAACQATGLIPQQQHHLVCLLLIT